MTKATARITCFCFLSLLATVACREDPPISPTNELSIYEVVIQDFHGDSIYPDSGLGFQLDPNILTPITRRVAATDSGPIRRHSPGVVDRLMALRSIRAVCELVPELGRCRNDEPGPVLQLSYIERLVDDTAAVSLLMYTVPTSRDSTVYSFAVEYRYRLVNHGGIWTVAAKRLEMIT